MEALPAPLKKRRETDRERREGETAERGVREEKK